MSAAAETPLPSSEPLRRTVEVLADHVGIARSREIAREQGLLGKEGRTLDPGALKRRLQDHQRLSRELFEAISDRARCNAALSTLRRMAHESLEAQKVDPRARTAFKKVATAINQNDRTRVERLEDQLKEMSREIPQDELLDLREAVVACLWADRARLVAALATLPIAPPPRSGALPSFVDVPTVVPHPRAADPTPQPAIERRITPPPPLPQARAAESPPPKPPPPQRAVLPELREAIARRVDTARTIAGRAPWSAMTVKAYERVRMSMSDLMDSPNTSSTAPLVAARDGVRKATHALAELETAAKADLRGHCTAIAGLARDLGLPEPAEDLSAAAETARASLEQLDGMEVAVTAALEGLSHVDWKQEPAAQRLIDLVARVRDGSGTLAELPRRVADLSPPPVTPQTPAAAGSTSEGLAAGTPDVLLAFSSGTPLAVPFPTSPLLVPRFASPGTPRGGPFFFLPATHQLSDDFELRVPVAGTSTAGHLTCAAANLVQAWVRSTVVDRETVARLLTLVADAGAIRPAASSAWPRTLARPTVRPLAREGASRRSSAPPARRPCTQQRATASQAPSPGAVWCTRSPPYCSMGSAPPCSSWSSSLA
jgi:hypothetical protein